MGFVAGPSLDEEGLAARNQSQLNRLEALLDQYRSRGQEHVFEFWDQLGDESRDALLSQAERLAPGLDTWLRARDSGSQGAGGQAGRAADRKIEPFEGVIPLPHTPGLRASFSEAAECGEAMLRDGRVGVMVVAGGQGTRLGFPGPKGGFPVGPVTDRTLFELQAQKIRRLGKRCGRALPWYVMTSAATDAATRELFEASNYYGLDPEDVFIFSQGMVPSFDFEGRLILEAVDRIFENPDGHGGAIPALVASGALSDMENRGIDTIYYYQVDNPLVRIGDPCYLGFHQLARAEMSCKVVRKRDPEAKVGVVAQVDGWPGMVEYTELIDADRFAIGTDGELLYWAGNIAIHLFDTGFVRRVEARSEPLLPYHLSQKKIPFVDATGERCEPAEPNGYKLERWVFDALSAAREICVVEVDPAFEFSPIKNADGNESAATARQDLTGLYRDWIEASPLESPPPDSLIEIDHSQIDCIEDAQSVPFASLAEATPVIRVRTGT